MRRGNYITTSDLSTDGKLMAYVTDSGHIQLLSVPSGNRIYADSIHTHIHLVRLSSDATKLIYVTADTLYIVDLAGGAHRSAYGLPVDAYAGNKPVRVTSLTITPDNMLYLGHPGKGLLEFKLNGDRKFDSQYPRLLISGLTYLDYIPATRELFTISGPNGCAVYNLGTNSIARSFNTQLGVSGTDNCMSISRSGKYLIKAWRNGTIEYFDLRTGATVFSFPYNTRQDQQASYGNPITASSISFSRDDRLIIGTFSDYTVRVFDAASGRLLRLFKGGGQGQAEFTPDGSHVIVRARNEILFYSTRTAITDNTTADNSPEATGLRKAALAKAPAPLSLKSGPALTVPYGHQHGMEDIFFNSSNEVMVTADDEITILWDVRSGKPLHYLTGTHPGFGPSERYLSTIQKNTVFVWDMATGHLIHFLPQDNTVIRAVFHPQKEQMIVLTKPVSYTPRNNTVTPTLWNFRTGQQDLTFQPATSHPDAASTVCTTTPDMYDAGFDADGSHIRVACDGSIKIFGQDDYTRSHNICLSSALKANGQTQFLSNDIMVNTADDNTIAWINANGQALAAIRLATPTSQLAGLVQVSYSVSPAKDMVAAILPEGIRLVGLKDRTDRPLPVKGAQHVYFNSAGTHLLVQRLNGTPLLYRLSNLNLEETKDDNILRGLPTCLFVVRTDTSFRPLDNFGDKIKDSILGTAKIPGYMSSIINSTFRTVTGGMASNAQKAYSNAGEIIDLRTGRTISVIHSTIPEPGDIRVASDKKSMFYRADGQLYLYSIPDAKFLAGFAANGFKCNFSPNGRWLVMVNPVKGVSLLIEASTGKILQQNKTAGMMEEAEVTVAPDGSSFVLVSRIVDGGLQRVDLATGRIVEDKMNILGYSISPDGGKKGYFLSGGTVSIVDTRTGVQLYNGKGTGVLFCNNPNKVVIKFWDHALCIPDLTKPTEIFEIREPLPQTYQHLVLSPDGKYLYMQNRENLATLCDLQRKQFIFRTNLNITVNTSFSDIGKGLKGATNTNDDFIARMVPGHTPLAAAFTTTGDSLSIYNNDTVTFYRCADGKPINTFFTEGNIRYVDVPNDILITFQHGQIKYYRISTASEWFTLVPFSNSEAAFVIPTGKYYGPRDAVSQMGYVTGLRSLSFQQFDAYNNRPDLVLQHLGSTNACLIKMLNTSYDLRLQRSGLPANAATTTAEAPSITILNEGSIPDEIHTDHLSLQLHGKDDHRPLTRLTIWDNGVPVYKQGGLPIEQKGPGFDMTVSIPLSEGRNYIETSVSNTVGMESLRLPLIVHYIPKKHIPPHIYFIGIGAGRYTEPGHDLPLVAKDIRDVAAIIRERYPRNSTIDTLINEKVSLEGLMALREHLTNARVDDIVILYFAGHGVLDRSKGEAFFGTPDFSFADPSAKGFSFHHFEGMFDGIAARNRVIFLDACHSGEINKTAWQQNTDCPVVKVRRAPLTSNAEMDRLLRSGDNDAANNADEQTPFSLMLSLFADVNPGDGSYVIAAAEGLESAGEDARLGNGVFTHCLLEGIKSRHADIDGNNAITIGEVKNYVIKEVKARSSGIQRPVSRRENYSYDWTLFEAPKTAPVQPVTAPGMDAPRGTERSSGTDATRGIEPSPGTAAPHGSERQTGTNAPHGTERPPGTAMPLHTPYPSAATLVADTVIQMKYVIEDGKITFDINCPGYLPALYADMDQNHRVDPCIDTRYMLFNKSGWTCSSFMLTDTTFSDCGGKGQGCTTTLNSKGTLQVAGWHYTFTIPFAELTGSRPNQIFVRFKLYSAEKGIRDYPVTKGRGGYFSNSYLIKTPQ